MPLITQETLEKFYPPRLIHELFADDGSREPGPRLGNALDAGSDEAAAILGKVPNWQSEEAMQLLVDTDTAVQKAISKLVMSIGYSAKPQWHAGGQTSAGDTWEKSAKTTLEDIVQRRLRTKAESVVGKNAVTLPKVANARQFEFARRRGKDSSGGF